MALCGAKNRSGQPCKAQAMPNGRCRMHGGKSTGAPAGNQNARQHGIYSDALTADEVELFDAIAVGELEQELKIARLQLRRALLAQNAADGKPELEEFTTHRGKGSRGKPREEKHRARNYTDVIQKLLGRIGDLEVRRVALREAGANGGEASAVETARLMQKAVADAMAVTGRPDEPPVPA